MDLEDEILEFVSTLKTVHIQGLRKSFSNASDNQFKDAIRTLAAKKQVVLDEGLNGILIHGRPIARITVVD